MKYLYAFECEKKGLSSPGELQAAIDSNRREGKRSSYTNGQYHFSPSPVPTPRAGVPTLNVHATAAAHNGMTMSPSPSFNMNSGVCVCVQISESIKVVIPKISVVCSLATHMAKSGNCIQTVLRRWRQSAGSWHLGHARLL